MTTAGFNVVPPSGAPGTAGSPGDRTFQRLTGTTHQESSVLQAGKWYTLMVSTATSVRVRFGSGSGSPPTAAATDMQVAAGGRLDFVPQLNESDIVSLLPDTGTFEAYLWLSEGGV